MLHQYFVLYGKHEEWFACQAMSAQHAAEQCNDFVNVWEDPSNQVLGVYRAKQEDHLRRERKGILAWLSGGAL